MNLAVLALEKLCKHQDVVWLDAVPSRILYVNDRARESHASKLPNMGPNLIPFTVFVTPI